MSDGPAFTLDTFKNAARRLRKAHVAGDPDARARVAAHVDPDKALRHADFLHVIAREEGQDSWPKLKFTVESAAMSRAEKAERLKVALYQGQHWKTDRLLAEDPTLKDDNLGLQIALYDLDSVRTVVGSDPGAAVRPVGIRSPILHLAFSKEIHRSPGKEADMMAIAELLVASGADVNDGYPYQPGDKDMLPALYGALCHADNFTLGRWLLDKGADPNDNESLYHATELGHTRTLELLLKHNARPDGTNALPRALDFENEVKVRMLLEAGADPNITVPDQPGGLPLNSIPALHQAVRRGRSAAIVELLLEFGADAKAVWQGHSPYALARIHGNKAAADRLAEKGHASPLSESETILAACADGTARPGRLDPDALTREDRTLLSELAACSGRLDHLKALVVAGLDPDMADDMGLPPLHIAGWHGLVPELSYFLSLEPDLSRKNHYGGDALDTVVHGSEFAPGQPEADHIACARLLLEAGSVLQPHYVSNCGNPDLAAFLEDWQERSGRV
ncbi:ankyrin repeat domain-containing protein [Labrenzia sp. OB1]|uniref:ankyrin repeat domain-containing protein n=1 Tax=Labrenzia sp. OB1 TaxID=1561204 RepID=UPI0007B216D0|nr:ankyrin repeat domain-containing protein [Labrenzia sp. OB1]KZM51479.1 ankyrin [Labrenzia sp. OB1]